MEIVRNKIILLIFLLLPTIISATLIDELFQNGNEKYRQGKYEEAIKFYETIISKGIKNGYLFYNLGNAYFKINEIGKAILNYERAKIYLPYNDDVQFNLRFVNSLKVDKIETKEYNPFTKVVLFVYNLFTVNTLFILVYIFLCLIVIGFIIKWFVKNISVRDISSRVFPYIVVIFIILFLILVLKLYDTENIRYGIVLAKESEVRSGPGEDYTVIFTLHEGTKIREHNRSGNFAQITLPNGYSGWIKRADIELIVEE